MGKNAVRRCVVGVALAAIMMAAVVAANALGAAGDLDSGFGTGGTVTTGFGKASGDRASDVAVQTDGKIVAVGATMPFPGDANGDDFVVVRYNANGTLDTSFGGDGIVTTDFGPGLSGSAQSVAIQSNGAIVVAGFTATQLLGGQGPGDFALARYTTTGALDTTFSGDGIVLTDFGGGDQANDVAIQPADGNIVAAGGTESNNGDFAVARYTTGGALDGTFSGDGKQTTDISGAGSSEFGNGVAVQPTDGRIVVAGSTDGNNGDFALIRYTTGGMLDGSFDGDGKLTTDFDSGSFDSANELAIQSNGMIVAGGLSNCQFALARYSTGGVLDGGFGSGGTQTTDFGNCSVAEELAIQPADGKIVAAGSVFGDFALARYTTGGVLDTFGSGGTQTTDIEGGSWDGGTGMALQANGRIVVAGIAQLNEFEPPEDFVLTRYTTGGLLDTSFSGDGKLDTVIGSGFADEARAVAVQSDGKIMVAGVTVDEAGVDDINLIVERYLPNGTLDPSFDGDGVVTTDIGGLSLNDFANGVAVQSDGKIVVAGRTGGGLFGCCGIPSGDFVLVRYNTNGSLDSSFSGDGVATTGFATGSIDEANDVAIQSNGAIVAAGRTDAGGSQKIAVARYTSGGIPDSSFSGDGKLTTAVGSFAEAHGVAIQPSDGAIVVAGRTDAGVNGGVPVVRYTTAGLLDPSFNGGAPATVDFGATFDDGNDVAIQPDGAIVIGGTARSDDAPSPPCAGLATGRDFALARLTSGGAPDTSLSGDGKLTTDIGGATQDEGNAVAIQSDGTILLAGLSVADFALARYQSNGDADTTFSGDGKLTTDIGGNGSCDKASDMAVTGAGILLAGSSDRRFALARYASSSPPPPTTTPPDTTSPNTSITKKPKKKITSRKAKFKFKSTESGSTFQCKLDRKPFKPCTSPKTYRNLKLGKHTFKVKATDAAGNTDPTPAKRKFKVVERR